MCEHTKQFQVKLRQVEASLVGQVQLIHLEHNLKMNAVPRVELQAVSLMSRT